MDEDRIKLEKFLFQELTDQLHSSVTKLVLETGNAWPTRDASFKRRFRHHQVANNSSASKALTQYELADSAAQQELEEQQTSEQIIEKIVQSAAKLNNSESNINILEKMLNDINKNIINQSIQMINATSNHVLESNLIDKSRHQSSIENNPKFLSQLLDLTFEQFKVMAKLYVHFIECASKQSQTRYQTGLVWTCIQNVLVQLLEEYLDIKQMTASAMGLSGQDPLDKIDLNSFFAKKRLINLPFGGGDSSTNLVGQGSTQNSVLGGAGTSTNFGMEDSSHKRIFAFKNSSHSMSITNYFKEQNKEDLFVNTDAERPALMNGEERVFKVLVCQPSSRNITTIFSTVERIVKEILDEIRMINEPTKPDSLLEKFLQEFILKTFISNAVESIKENARIMSNEDGRYEISKQLIPFSKQRELGLNKPILQNILLVYQSCVDLFNLIKDMNSYATEFSRAMHSLIEKHADYCNKLFLSIVTNESNGEYVYSMRWVQDAGIKQYFKQLPAFSAAIKGKLSPAAQLTLAKNSKTQNPAILAANAEIEQVDLELLSKEVETLIANFDEKELEEVDIITNFNYIETIAHLHESSDWLIVQLKFIVNSLEQMVKNPKSLSISLSKNELNRLVKQLDELDQWRGDTLLLLYLETRVHCFYHLINFIKQENITSYAGDLDTDPEECVLNMNRDLHRIYEHLTRSLQESKVNYVFDALGFMIANIFIKAVKNFKKISSHGIAKMCRNIFHVEQNLSAIRTKSDPHLMKAHRFYELLYKKPEELLNHLLEHEAEFQLNDYINLLNLIYRSQPGYEINSLTDNIQSLTNILKNKH
jgi:hypothetical protein